jgi:hypothetical protein
MIYDNANIYRMGLMIDNMQQNDISLMPRNASWRMIFCIIAKPIDSVCEREFLVPKFVLTNVKTKKYDKRQEPMTVFYFFFIAVIPYSTLLYHIISPHTSTRRMLQQRSDYMANLSMTSFFDTDHDDHHAYHQLFAQQSSALSSMAPPFGDYSPSSVFAKSMHFDMKHAVREQQQQHQQRQRRTVRWGSAYTYESTTNPDDFAIMWYNVRFVRSFSFVSMMEASFNF